MNKQSLETHCPVYDLDLAYFCRPLAAARFPVMGLWPTFSKFAKTSRAEVRCVNAFV